MRATRFSRWQRRAGVVVFVAAGAILLASCSSGPVGVRSPGPPAKAPASTAAVKTVQFPSGPVAEHIYGPSWARFVAAFPGKVVVSTNPVTTCVVGSLPVYLATVGTPLRGGAVKPPSYDVGVWRCGTAARAADYVRAILVAVRVPHTTRVIDGQPAEETALTASRYGSRGGREWTAGIVVRVGAEVFIPEQFTTSSAAARAFLDSFHLNLAGYTPAPVK